MDFRHKLKHYVRSQYSILLAFLVLLFIFRPTTDAGVYMGIWKFFLISTLVVAVFDCNHQKWVRAGSILLAIPSLAFTWIFIFHRTTWVEACLGLSTELLLLLCSIAIVYSVLVKARVTVETLRGVVCAYFLVAFLFAYIFTSVEFIIPDSFSIHGNPSSGMTFVHFFSEMLYFSFITLLTIGYGDIVPVLGVGQTTAVIEGIIGQFYIAILVARIVAVYSLASEKLLIKDVEKDIGISRKHPKS